MTTPACQRERGRLAEALKALWVGAGLSGARLAEMLGWQQPKVSKIETRKQLPSEDDIAAWVGAAGAAPETASDLLAMLRGAGGIRGLEGRLPRIRGRRCPGRHRGTGSAGNEDRGIPARHDLGPAADLGICAGVPAPGVRAAQLRPGPGRDRPDGREPDATAAGALSAHKAGPGGHARGS